MHIPTFYLFLPLAWGCCFDYRASHQGIALKSRALDVLKVMRDLAASDRSGLDETDSAYEDWWYHMTGWASYSLFLTSKVDAIFSDTHQSAKDCLATLRTVLVLSNAEIGFYAHLHSGNELFRWSLARTNFRRLLQDCLSWLGDAPTDHLEGLLTKEQKDAVQRQERIDQIEALFLPDQHEVNRAIVAYARDNALYRLQWTDQTMDRHLTERGYASSSDLFDLSIIVASGPDDNDPDGYNEDLILMMLQTFGADLNDMEYLDNVAFHPKRLLRDQIGRQRDHVLMRMYYLIEKQEELFETFRGVIRKDCETFTEPNTSLLWKGLFPAFEDLIYITMEGIRQGHMEMITLEAAEQELMPKPVAT